MKLALFYMSKDMYSHDCEYTRTAKLNQPEQEVFDYFVSEWGTSRAAIRMYIVDEETLTMTLAKELIRPLKVKIVINAKKEVPNKGTKPSKAYNEVQWPSFLLNNSDQIITSFGAVGSAGD